jgi:hypothetical protein
MSQPFPVFQTFKWSTNEAHMLLITPSFMCPEDYADMCNLFELWKRRHHSEGPLPKDYSEAQP